MKYFLEVHRKLANAATIIEKRIYYNESDSPEEVKKKVASYVAIGYEKELIEDFELFKGIDEETFRPYVLVLVKIKRKKLTVEIA